MANMLTPSTFESIPAYDLYFRYVNTKKFDDEKNIYLQFTDEFVNQVSDGSDGQAKDGKKVRLAIWTQTSSYERRLVFLICKLNERSFL